MNSKRIVLAVVLALAIAGVFSWFVIAYQRKQQAAKVNFIKVVAATKPLPAGSPINDDSVTLIDWPASIPITGAFTNLNDVKNRSVIYPINEHQPILDHDVAQPGSGIGLTVKIPEGMRAVSVRSNDVVGVAGFLYPGSHVDVLVTSKLDGNSLPLTQTVLPNVEVLVAGQRTEPDPQGKPETVNVVTLLLKPEDGEKLVLAASQGQIQFVLRNGADQNTPDTKPVDMTDLMAGVKKPVAPKAIAGAKAVARVEKQKPPAVVYYEVETIKGASRSVDKFE
jgi:pilus assembly protein CpaB